MVRFAAEVSEALQASSASAAGRRRGVLVGVGGERPLALHIVWCSREGRLMEPEELRVVRAMALSLSLLHMPVRAFVWLHLSGLRPTCQRVRVVWRHCRHDSYQRT